MYNPYYVPGSPLWSGGQSNGNYWPAQGTIYSYGEGELGEEKNGKEEDSEGEVQLESVQDDGNSQSSSVEIHSSSVNEDHRS